MCFIVNECFRMSLMSRKKLLLSLVLCVLFLSSILYSWKKENEAVEFHKKRMHTMLRAEEQQLRRKDYVIRQCRRLKQITDADDLKELSTSTLSHLIVDDTRNLIYCTVPKVASTNWKRVLIALSAENEHQYNPTAIRANVSHAYHFKTLAEDNEEDILHKLENYFKFLFVRHPLERLVSAYRNKFESVYTNYFRLHFGRDIVKKYRPNASEESLRLGHDVTFKEFLLYVANLNTSGSKKEFNDHWRPIYDMCMPCTVNYSVIGNYETLENDANYILWKLGVLDKMEFPKRNMTYSSQPSTKLMKQYYSNIPPGLIKKLLKIYRNDMLLFQYNPMPNELKFP